MLRYISFLFLMLVVPVALAAQSANREKASEFSYLVRPAFTFLMSTEQTKNAEELVLSMYGQLRSQMSFDVSAVHVKSYLNADFKREAYSDAAPRNLRDDLIVSFIPSVHISDKYKVSLFLELTMETDMAHGERDGIRTSFMDPAFFYETLYIGQWADWKSDDKSQRLSFRYGVGYAFQQTMTSNFLLTGERNLTLDPENPLSAIRKARSVKLESGYSALASFEYLNDFTDNLSFFLKTFGIALSKGDLGSFFENPHAVAEFETGLTYKVFSFRYNLRLVYDPNYSSRRQLDQSATFGIQLEFKD
ncbi:MAG: hypothetical protein IH600_05025 [Bacteroidetes bacterium]|nr:hypothetical protein [Bacteroidota bacterium]